MPCACMAVATGLTQPRPFDPVVADRRARRETPALSNHCAASVVAGREGELGGRREVWKYGCIAISWPLASQLSTGTPLAARVEEAGQVEGDVPAGVLHRGHAGRRTAQGRPCGCRRSPPAPCGWRPGSTTAAAAARRRSASRSTMTRLNRRICTSACGTPARSRSMFWKKMSLVRIARRRRDRYRRTPDRPGACKRCCARDRRPRPRCACGARPPAGCR